MVPVEGRCHQWKRVFCVQAGFEAVGQLGGLRGQENAHHDPIIYVPANVEVDSV